MSVIVNGIGPTSGASALGDLTDIGTMGEPIAQADNLTEVVTAMGGASAVRTAIDAAEDGATLPSASAAGQMLISTASGTSYAARARVLSGTLAERDALSPVREGDQWYVSSGASSGTFWQRVNGAWQFRPMGTTADDVLAELGAIKAPTSPTAGHVLTYDGSVWQSAAPATASSAGVPVALLAGAAHVDLTTDTLVGGSPGAVDPAEFSLAGRTTVFTLTLAGSVSVVGLTGVVELVSDTGVVVATRNVTATVTTSYTFDFAMVAGAHTYELRARLTASSGPGDYLTLIGAAIRVSWS